jgi:SAM-dependent methyltransferase
MVEFSCRSCGHSPLVPVLDLGNVPLANSLLSADEVKAGTEERFPLALFFCPDCTLVQIGESVVPAKLFSHYLYASSFSETMINHSRALVERMIIERKLTPQDRVIEVASNDGYLLQFYKQAGIEVLGIEPAANIAAMAEKKGIPTRVEFFGSSFAETLAAEGTLADVMHAHNVFAHVPNPADFVAGIKRVLKPGGVMVIEAPYLGELIDKLEFDTIYHEHFSYFSLHAVDHMVHRNELMLSDVELVPIHGGSLRMFITHAGAEASPRVAAMLADEKRKGMTRSAYYADFADRVWALKEELLALLRRFRSEDKRVAAYGASAKGSTLMNAFGIGRELIDFVVDRSTLKQGKYTPGNHIPILPPEALMERRPDCALLLTWNFAEEILRQQQAYRDAGGKFIVPLPALQVI